MTPCSMAPAHCMPCAASSWSRTGSRGLPAVQHHRCEHFDPPLRPFSISGVPFLHYTLYMISGCSTRQATVSPLREYSPASALPSTEGERSSALCVILLLRLARQPAAQGQPFDFPFIRLEPSAQPGSFGVCGPLPSPPPPSPASQPRTPPSLQFGQLAGLCARWTAKTASYGEGGIVVACVRQ